MVRESGYDPVIVFDWLATHGTSRGDGRFLTLNHRLLEDTHRDTFARWELAANTDPGFRVPLGRWDEILLIYGVMLNEFEAWAEEVYGTTGYEDGDGAALDEAA